MQKSISFLDGEVIKLYIHLYVMYGIYIIYYNYGFMFENYED